MKTGVRKRVNALDIDTYFTRLAELMKTSPPTPQDAPMVARMAQIGLLPGKNYDPFRLSSVDHELLKVGKRSANPVLALALRSVSLE